MTPDWKQYFSDHKEAIQGIQGICKKWENLSNVWNDQSQFWTVVVWLQVWCNMGTFVKSVVHKTKMVSEDGKNGKTRVKPRTTGRSGSFGFWRLVGRPRVGPPISLCVLQRPATREEVFV